MSECASGGLLRSPIPMPDLLMSARYLGEDTYYRQLIPTPRTNIPPVCLPLIISVPYYTSDVIQCVTYCSAGTKQTISFFFTKPPSFFVSWGRPKGNNCKGKGSRTHKDSCALCPICLQSSLSPRPISPITCLPHYPPTHTHSCHCLSAPPPPHPPHVYTLR